MLADDPNHVECYKLRGLIYLSLHKDTEAYSDFRSAIKLESTKVFPSENQKGNQKGTERKKENESRGNKMAFRLADQSKKVMLLQGEENYLIDESFVFNLKPETSSSSSKNSFINLIDIFPFERGLSMGILEGGVDAVIELGPFLFNLTFHPYDTTKQIVEAIQVLVGKAIDRDWSAVIEGLAPELKELFTTWDKIDDYQRGRLAGLFIGKNGVGALTALGAMQGLSKVKNVVVNISKPKITYLLSHAKPKVTPLKTAELSLLAASQGEELNLPLLGGVSLKKDFYGDPNLAQLISAHHANEYLTLCKL